jgi:hypothetical protein
MKVFIGPYKSWIGPYHVFGWTKKFLSEERYEKLVDFVQPFFEWLDSKRQRIVKVHIDKYDTWSMDYTLALVVLPMLKQLKETKHGAPLVDDCDVPEELRRSSAPPAEDYQTDSNWFLRWDYVMDEMIFAFEYITQKDDEFNSEIDKRVNTGLKLFGKYYRGLWD